MILREGRIEALGSRDEIAARMAAQLAADRPTLLRPVQS
jgi:hypothetical protein